MPRRRRDTGRGRPVPTERPRVYVCGPTLFVEAVAQAPFCADECLCASLRPRRSPGAAGTRLHRPARQAAPAGSRRRREPYDGTGAWEVVGAMRTSGSREHQIVVVGGGFGGLQAVSNLRRAPVEITPVDRRNFYLFQPLTYHVATGALSPSEIAFTAARARTRRAPLPRQGQPGHDRASSGSRRHERHPARRLCGLGNMAARPPLAPDRFPESGARPHPLLVQLRDPRSWRPTHHRRFDKQRAVLTWR